MLPLMAILTVDLEGLPELDRAMREMVHAADNLRPVFDADHHRLSARPGCQLRRRRPAQEMEAQQPRLDPACPHRRPAAQHDAARVASSIRQAFERTLRVGSRLPYAFLNETGRLRPRRSMINSVTPAVRQRWAELLIDAMAEPWAQGATGRFRRSTRRRRRRR